MLARHIADPGHPARFNLVADDSLLAFLADADDDRGVHLHDVGAGTTVRLGAAGAFDAILGTAETPAQFAMSADGARIAFVATSPADTATLHIYDRATGIARTVADCFDPPVDLAALSADGSTLVYRSGGEVRGYTFATDTGFDLPLTLGDAAPRGGAKLSVSADGTRVALAGMIDGTVRIGLHDRADRTTRWLDAVAQPAATPPSLPSGRAPSGSRSTPPALRVHEREAVAA